MNTVCLLHDKLKEKEGTLNVLQGVSYFMQFIVEEINELKMKGREIMF